MLVSLVDKRSGVLHELPFWSACGNPLCSNRIPLDQMNRLWGVGMNRIYRLIWNADLYRWLVVPEIAKRHGKPVRLPVWLPSRSRGFFGFPAP